MPNQKVKCDYNESANYIPHIEQKVQETRHRVAQKIQSGGRTSSRTRANQRWTGK